MKDNYYYETLKRALTDPNLTPETLKELVDGADFFFQVLRVKLESEDPILKKEAAQELTEFRKLLEKASKAVKKRT
jgi:hypothetical protein